MGGPVRVLDVGCGTGQMAPAFIGHRYLGVDLEARFLRAAPRHHGFDYAVMDARQLAVPSESVDLVLVSRPWQRCGKSVECCARAAYRS